EGFVPGPVAVAGNRIWLGDLGGGRVLGVDRTAFAAAEGAGNSPPGIDLGCTANYTYVSALLAVGNDLYVLCSATDGYLVRLDARSGAIKGDKLLVGASPIALAQMFDGRLAVVNSTSGTLSLVTPGAASMAVGRDVLAFANSSDLEDVRAWDRFLYVVSANTQTLIKVDAAAAPPRIVDEVSLNPNGEPNSDPTRVEVLDENTAVVCDSGLGRVVGVQFGAKGR